MRPAPLVLGIDHGHPRLIVIQMPLDHRQRAFADRAEADHDNGASDLRVDLRGGAHGNGLSEKVLTDNAGISGGTPLYGLRRLAVTSISTFISGFRRPATTSIVAAGLMSPRTSPLTANSASAYLTSVT